MSQAAQIQLDLAGQREPLYVHELDYSHLGLCRERTL